MTKKVITILGLKDRYFLAAVEQKMVMTKISHQIFWVERMERTSWNFRRSPKMCVVCIIKKRPL